MTDLKSLLEQAAGGEPAVTDKDLAADLSRGKRSARRRGAVTITAGVAATALVIGGGWTLLPDAKPSGSSPDPGVAASASTPPLARSTGRPGRPPQATRRPEQAITPPPRPKNPVELVADGVRHPGMNIVCDLKPKGWVVKVYTSGWEQEGDIGGGSMRWSDPKVKRPIEGFDHLNVSPATFSVDEKGQKIVPKYINGWDFFPHYKAGPYQAVISHYPNKERVPMSANGEVQIHMKIDENNLIDVWAVAPRLGWDVGTALRYAGSCHPVR